MSSQKKEEDNTMTSVPLSSNRIKRQEQKKPNSPRQSPSVSKKADIQNLDPLPLDIETIQAATSEPTLGQRVADVMAERVGSWAFLIGQTIVLTGWVGANLMPGVPHWDQSPFILLNLVFSFASAYTAPVVLMSQNRQSEEERKKAQYDHLVNRKASHDIELLHKKIDILQSQQLRELTQIIKQQQQQLNETKSIPEPFLKAQQSSLNIAQVSETNPNALPTFEQSQQLPEYKVNKGKLPNQKHSVYTPFSIPESTEDESKTVNIIYASLGDSENP